MRLDSDGIGAALGATAGTTAARADLTTPEIVSFGLYHEIDSAWAVMAEANWTRWSRLRVLRVKFDGASPGNEVIEEDWRDTWFLALGWQLSPEPGVDLSLRRWLRSEPIAPPDSNAGDANQQRHSALVRRGLCSIRRARVGFRLQPLLHR